jgi:hypothetical protein
MIEFASDYPVDVLRICQQIVGLLSAFYLATADPRSL